MTTTTLGYTIFYVADVVGTLRFFTEGFGLQEKFITPEDDYGELDTGATTLAFVSLALGRAGLDVAGGFTPIDPAVPPPGASITFVTDDVESTLQTALKAGGSLYVEPVEKPWGQTVAYLRDPNGILLEVATAVPA